LDFIQFDFDSFISFRHTYFKMYICLLIHLSEQIGETNIRTLIRYGSTPLMEAVEHNHVGCVRILLKHGASTKQVSGGMRSLALKRPLNVAMISGYTDIVAEILSAITTATKADASEETAGHASTTAKNAATGGAPTGEDLESLVFNGVIGGALPALQLLLDGPAAADDDEGASEPLFPKGPSAPSPLLIAIVLGNREVASLVNDKLPNQYRPSLMWHASRRGNVPLLETAIVASAPAIETALLWEQHHTENSRTTKASVVTSLLQSRTSRWGKDVTGLRPLDIAVENGHVAAVARLLDLNGILQLKRNEIQNLELEVYLLLS
jgi:ankyrin repeat protein